MIPIDVLEKALKYAKMFEREMKDDDCVVIEQEDRLIIRGRKIYLEFLNTGEVYGGSFPLLTHYIRQKIDLHRYMEGIIMDI